MNVNPTQVSPVLFYCIFSSLCVTVRPIVGMLSKYRSIQIKVSALYKR